MVQKSANGSLRSIVKLLAVQSLRGASDPELLARFVDANDEAAFRVIAERHGPMVLGVCKRALRCEHDAEDAFQATFLVFARKAGAIRKSKSLGSWLHGVALRIAAKLKRSHSRRLRHEHSTQRTSANAPDDALTWAEVKSGLDEELQRLPSHYREVLILCYLEAKTRDEAAQQLGLSVGTVHGRLERGRKLLADRLTRRGLMLSAGLVAVAVAPDSVQAAVKAASLFAIQHSAAGVVSPRVLSLTNEFLKGMAMNRVKLLVATMVSALVLVAGVGFSPAQAPPGKVDGPWEIEVRWPTYAAEDLPLVNASANESDDAFIRRISQDLRGKEPSTTEVHFFVKSKDAKKRDQLVDLFVKEREEKKQAEAERERHTRLTLRMDRFREVQLLAERKELELQKARVESAAEAELALLRNKVDLAKATLKEKQLLLILAKNQKPSDTDIDLRNLDLEKALLALKEAELNLTIAEKKSRYTKSFLLQMMK